MDVVRVNKAILLLLFLVPVMLMSGCLPGDGRNSEEDPAGLFWGIWHGWVAPVSLVVGLFSDGIRIYEKANSGWWYDLGFYAAIISGFGGLSLSRKNKNSER